MGKAKAAATAPATDKQTHELSESEYNMLKLMNVALQYNVAGQKIISGFIYYICNSRFGYEDGVNLQFEIDFDKDDKQLAVTVLPAVVE